MQFDPNTFETLRGPDLANYAIAVGKDGIAERDLLPYFHDKAAAMDMPHLELAVGMLGRVGSKAAYQMVAEYLDHPDFNVRFVATKIIARMTAVDDQVMSRVVKSLSHHINDPMGAAL